jgi:5-methylcytosine-specific restriction enzyme subunit McrC
MSPTIPIQNIYYLLCYAWNKLDQGSLVDVSQVEGTELADLFAHVLCDGIRHLARRGLDQGYQLHDEDLSGVRGRINISDIIRRALIFRGRLSCSFDDLTSNVLSNKILKTTLRGLSNTPELDTSLRKTVRTTYRRMRGIDEIELSSSILRAVQIRSNNRFYRFLLNVCELIYEALLAAEQPGSARFRDYFRDEKRMAALFQAFVFKFAERECPQWTVKVENISWRAASETDPQLNFLPRM